MLTHKAVTERIQGLKDEMSSLHSQVESMQSRYKGNKKTRRKRKDQLETRDLETKIKNKSSYVKKEMDKIIEACRKSIDQLNHDIQTKQESLQQLNIDSPVSTRKLKNTRLRQSRDPNDLPLRDKNGRFVSNKNSRDLRTKSRSAKTFPKTTGIATRLRKRPQENSSKRVPSNTHKRITRQMIKFNSTNSNSNKSTKHEEEKLGK